MLARDFIRAELYAPRVGYFASGAVVARVDAPLPFTQLAGRAEYERRVAALYAASAGGGAR